MAYTQKELTGSLFKNQKRETDNHPNMTGSALIDGVEYWVSGWTKTGNTDKWISLAFKKKEAKPVASSAHEPRNNDEDIPF